MSVPIDLCARALRVSPSTIARCGRPRPPWPPRERCVDNAARARVRSIVRATHGVVGARGLNKQTGVPRRVCAEIKRHELLELEYERKARCASVTITTPGIVRGFDAMHIETVQGKAYWLVAADAAVPFRTSIATVARTTRRT